VAVINPAVERVETAPKAEQPKAEVKANVPVEKPKDAAEVKNINTEKLKSAAVAVINPAVERVETTPKAEPMKPEQMKPGKSEPVVVKPVYDAPKPATTPASKPTQQPNGRAFVVQIMASATPLSIDDARFGKQQGKVCQYVADGAYKYKYCVGRYADRAAAQQAATALRLEFSGAFVIEVEGQNVVKR
jgi:N-acetylmuramoyl-L-alanine amidase